MAKKSYTLFLISLLFSCLSSPEPVKETVQPRNKSLHELVISGDENRIKEIFKVDANIDELDSNGRTALHIATASKNNQIARLLLIQGADTNIQDKEGNTPLHLAINTENLEIIPDIISRGASIFIKDELGRTPFKLSSVKGLAYTKALISDSSIRSLDNNGKSILHFAAEEGEFEIIEYLVSRNIDVNIRDNKNLLPIDYTLTDKTSLNHAKSAALLIKNKSFNAGNREFDYLYRILKTDDLDFRFESNKTALHIAAESDHYGFMELFINQGANLELQDKPGNTPLHTAVVNNNLPIVKLLLNNGANIDARDFNNNTPLHLSLSFSYSDNMPNYLVENGADIDAKDNYGNTPLHLIISLKLDSSLAKMLIDQGADFSIRNKIGNTPLTEAISKNNKNISLLLLKDLGGIYSKNERGESPLTIALGLGTSVLEWLISDKNINYQDNDGNTPLLIAIDEGVNADIISFLIEKGAKINIRNKDGWTALHKAVNKGNKEIVDVLAANGADFFAVNNNGNNSFDLIFEKGESYTSSIITNDLVKLRNNRMNTPLFYAIDWGSIEIVKIILDKDAEINAKNINGETPLHQTVISDNSDIAKLLITRGATLEASDNQKNTPLHNCVTWNSSEVARVLIENGANINAKNITDRTPLHEAVALGEKSIANFLLRNKANINARDNNGQTPLYYAVKNNSYEIARILIDNGADISLRDRQGNTILHASILGEHKESSKLLMSKNTDIYAENKFGDTPVSLVITSSIETVKWFFDSSNINSMDNKGYTPLHLGIKYRIDLETIKYLINLGGDKYGINKDGNTPLDMAIQTGWNEVIPYLK
jgi:uncharacterized protein